MNKAGQLIEYIIRDIVEYLIQNSGIDIKEAMAKFYGSEVFAKLNDTETGLYLCSSAYVCALFQDEMRHGKIIQNEI